MAMADFEPNSGFNLPAGCFDVPDTGGGDDNACIYCQFCHCITDDHGICIRELEDAEDSGKFSYRMTSSDGTCSQLVFSPLAVVEWVATHVKRMSTDGCADFKEYGA